MYQINDDIPLGCIYESEDSSTKYCPMCNHDDVPYCQWFEDEPEAAIGIDERPVYCPILPSAQPEPCEDAVSRQAEIKCCTFGRTSLGLIDELRRLPSVTAKADGCWECAFVERNEWEMPCSRCKRNCKDYWRPAREEGDE